MKKIVIVIIGLIASNVIIAQNSSMRIDFGEIEIPIGYKIQISAEHNDLKIENFKLLGKSIAEKTIDMIKALDEFERKDTITNEMEFEFCNADFAGSKMIILTTVHHQEKPMTFNAKIKIKGRKKYITTSIVTKYPHAISIEQWSENIESIILYDFKLISEIN